MVLILVAAGAVHNELLGPVIRAVPIRADDPLTVRFAVFNPAFTVTLKNVDMTCMPLTLAGRGRNGQAWTAQGRPFPLNVDLDVGPRQAFEYTCPIDTAASPDSLDHVTADIAVRYTRFGRRERMISGTLNWGSASRVWTMAGR
ncbi:MAG TPA: hypothetical protein VMU31_02915 [Rhizomicrobium sp.]|nr:hypothetical protein [Rhizomicrobium sp.]